LGSCACYVEGMWSILQQDEPDDYVLAIGERHSVREFVTQAFAYIGRTIIWQGTGVNEKDIDKATGQVLIEVDPRYSRPTEVDVLIGDPSKARSKLGWQHKTSFDTLVKQMVEADMAAVQESRRNCNS
jgi:GDPmannose 4,6-dehydratase